MQITNEVNVTENDLLNEANIIWSSVKKYPNTDVDFLIKLLSEYQKSHPQFSKSYPIVLKYMVIFRSYNENAFRLYLKKIKNNPWKSESDYLDSQADYVVLLYKNTHSHWKLAEVQNLYQNIRNQLQLEHDNFKNNVKMCEDKVTKQHDLLRKKAKNDLIKFTEIAKNTFETRCGTVRVESNINCSPQPVINPTVTKLDISSENLLS